VLDKSVIAGTIVAAARLAPERLNVDRLPQSYHQRILATRYL
jgi:hypothetical protein